MLDLEGIRCLDSLFLHTEPSYNLSNRSAPHSDAAKHGMTSSGLAQSSRASRFDLGPSSHSWVAHPGSWVCGQISQGGMVDFDLCIHDSGKDTHRLWALPLVFLAAQPEGR